MSNGNSALIKANRRKIIRRVSLVLGAAFVLYVLLEGLAYRLWEKDIISHKTFASVYGPILYLDHHCVWFSHLDDDYENLWFNQVNNFLDGVYGKNRSHTMDPPAFFTLQDFFDFAIATVIVGCGATMVYFPQWIYRAVSPKQIVQHRKRIRICGLIMLAVDVKQIRVCGLVMLTVGIILILTQCHDLLVYGF